MHPFTSTTSVRCTLVAVVALLSVTASAQSTVATDSVSVRGIVVDADGETLPGATIKDANGRPMAVTDAEGRFATRGVKGQSWSVSYIGMQPLQFVTTDQEERLTLLPEAGALSDVVITGYSRVNARLFVGAVGKISTDHFAHTPQPDLARLLQDQAPGLNISVVSNTFGAAPKMDVRGGGSINGTVQPLWVVDGTVVEDLVNLSPEQLVSGDASTLVGSAIAGLNPSDIESVEVLKDASATSLYGARGMNGVVVVTTKGGRTGTGLQVNYHLTSSIRQRPSYSELGLMNSAESMQMYNEMEAKGLLTRTDALYGRRGGVYSQMYALMEQGTEGEYILPNTPQAKADFLARAAARNTDWFKELYTASITQNHSLSVSYGGDKHTAYASLGLYHDPGETVADRVRRLTALVKTSFQLSPRLTAKAQLQANLRDQNAPGTLPRIRNLEKGTYHRDFDINPYRYASSTSRTLRPRDERGQYEYYRNEWAPFNILEEYDQNAMQLRLNDVTAQISAEWQPLKDLRVNGHLSIRRASTAIEHRLGERSNMVKSMRANASELEKTENTHLLRSSQGEPRVPLTMGGILMENHRTLTTLLARLSADYNHRWGLHRVGFFAFAEGKRSDTEHHAFTGYGIAFEQANAVTTSPLIFEKTLGEGDNYFSLRNRYTRSVALSASAQYSFDARYIANLVMNYEGANSAGAGRGVRWLPTWNVGLKWNIDAEPFFRHQRLAQALALRASYGLVAKMNDGVINSQAVYDTRLTFRQKTEDREYGIYLRHLENRDLTWEKMYEANVGMDVTLLQRFHLSVDGYLRSSFDLIDHVATSGLGGEYYKWLNYGDMQTVGVDLTLRVDLLQQKDWRWNATLGYSTYHQQITHLRQHPNAFDLVAGTGQGNVEGKPRGALFSYQFAGLTDRGLPSFYLGETTKGDPLQQVSGANFYDTTQPLSYLKYEGATAPTSRLSLATTLRFKAWELSAVVSAQWGHYIRLAPTYDPTYKDINVFTQDYRKRWMTYGDERLTHVPVLPGRDLYALLGAENIERAYNTYHYSNVNVVSGAFARLKSLTLAYHLPEKVVQHLHLKSLTLFAQATHPLMFWSDKRLSGRDPEFVSAGGVATPTPRTYSLSLQLTL